MYYVIKEQEHQAILEHVKELIANLPKSEREKIETPVNVSDYGKHYRSLAEPEKNQVVIDCGEYDLHGAYDIHNIKSHSTIVFNCLKAVKHSI